MQALTSKAQQVDRRPMTFLEKMYLPAIAKGMGITFSHIFKRSLPLIIQKKQGHLALYLEVYMY